MDSGATPGQDCTCDCSSSAVGNPDGSALDGLGSLNNVTRAANLVLAGEAENIKPGSPVFWVFLAIVVFLVLFAGLMSGLTLGLLSFDEVDLLVIQKSGTEKQKRAAGRILSIFKHQHWLLVTLLVCNAIAMEALPVFLTKISNEVVAIAISVTAVLLFGEVIPQALCKRFGLMIGSSFTSVVKVLMFATCVVSWPVAKLLDMVVGVEDGGILKRKQLEALVEFHGLHAGRGGELSQDEVKIIKGALTLSAKPAVAAMTPLDMVFMLSADDKLGPVTLQEVLDSGYSRVPVHMPGSREDVLGVLLVKELLMLDPEDETPVHEMHLYTLPRLMAETKMYDVLNIFQTGKSHMALLMSYAAEAHPPQGPPTPPSEMEEDEDVEQPLLEPPFPAKNKPRIYYQQSGAGPKHIGIITIEDILEELLQEEIVDETDRYVDNLQVEVANPSKLVGGLSPTLRQMLPEDAVHTDDNQALPPVLVHPRLKKQKAAKAQYGLAKVGSKAGGARTSI